MTSNTGDIENFLHRPLVRSTSNDEFVAFHNNTFNKTIYFFAIIVGIGIFIFLGIFVYDFILHG